MTKATAPWGVVLVPTEAGRALRVAGACGSTPPMVHRSRSGAWSAHGDWSDTDESGIPLLWADSLVPEGWDRARRAWLDHVCAQQGPWRMSPGAAAELMWPNPTDILALSRQIVGAGLSRVVLLDLVDGVVRERVP